MNAPTGENKVAALLDKLNVLALSHADIMGAAWGSATFSVRVTGQGIFCWYCTDESAAPARSASQNEIQALTWMSTCEHRPTLSWLITAIEDDDLSAAFYDIIAIRKPRTFGFDQLDLASDTRSVLTVGLAYSAFQQFVEMKLVEVNRRDQGPFAEAIRRELLEARTFLKDVHMSSIGSNTARKALRKEASRFISLSKSEDSAWVVLGYVKVSIADNHLLQPQTIARALQASYAPQSLEEAQAVSIPFWVGQAIMRLSPQSAQSSLHTDLTPEVVEAAETLWREASGGVFADFDVSVAAAHRLN